MDTIRYGFPGAIKADEILAPPEIPDFGLKELFARTDDFIAFRSGNTVSAIKRDKIKSICIRTK